MARYLTATGAWKAVAPLHIARRAANGHNVAWTTLALGHRRYRKTVHRWITGKSVDPAFKELAGISRKYAIPLLEYLDRQRVTRREGDRRVIL